MPTTILPDKAKKLALESLQLAQGTERFGDELAVVKGDTWLHHAQRMPVLPASGVVGPQELGPGLWANLDTIGTVLSNLQVSRRNATPSSPSDSSASETGAGTR